MSFVLVLKICSSIQLACSTPMMINTFDNHYDCAINGYATSQKIIKDIGREEVIKDKIVINFTCYENNSYKTSTYSIEKPKQI